MNLHVIIAAAGRSERYGSGDKLAADLGGRAVLLRTVEAFARRQEVGGVIVAAPPDGLDEFRAKFGPTLSFHGARIVEGGRHDRCETVRKALAHVPDDATHVAVHDAARPAVTDELLDRIFEAAGTLDAVVPGVSVRDTVKRVSQEATAVEEAEDAVADSILGQESRRSVSARAVVETIDRGGLVLVQTPQVFSVGLLRRAYQQSDLRGVTDDAGAVERLGETVYVVEGDARNLKITTPRDLALVRLILGLKAPAERPVHKRF
jgi:2-C-methyl-D-erythritol 4-phosphate cytidylyltransferase